MDAVDRIVDQWRRERPDLDPSPMLVIGRLHRLAGLLEAELRPVFADAGLGDGDFDVLATLRRAGSPFLLTPGQLAEQTMVTTGATTKRLDRLQARGLIAREVSATDGRVRLVRLTDTGLATVDAVVGNASILRTSATATPPAPAGSTQRLTIETNGLSTTDADFGMPAKRDS